MLYQTARLRLTMKEPIVHYFKNYYNSNSLTYNIFMSVLFGICGSAIFLEIGYGGQIPTTIHNQFMTDMFCSFCFAFILQAYIVGIIMD